VWGTVLGLALLVTLNPVRLAVILLVISRPRPVQNLFVYWVGCMIVSFPAFMVPLVVLHATPTSASFTKDLATPGTATNAVAQYFEIGLGVVALSIAVLMAVRFSSRRGAHVPAPRGNTSTPVLDLKTPTAISRLVGRPTTGGGRHRAQYEPTAAGSAIRRLLGHTRNAWENGSLWVAFVIGLLMVPSLDGVVLIIGIIVASGTTIGTQISATVAFIVGMLAVEEVILASYLATPAKTQAVVRRLNDWARAHHRKVLVAVFALVGVSLVAYGMGAAGG
jgi:hypothetical protein